MAGDRTKPICNGICITGAEIGVGPAHLIAYAHPECDLHSGSLFDAHQTRRNDLEPDQEED